ncbi:MAG TPA: hypothetical protein VGM06_04705 [Polyangiaceae bacterium]|jgi:hypothetical protein
MPTSPTTAILAAALCGLLACSRQEPPAPAGSPSIALADVDAAPLFPSALPPASAVSASVTAIAAGSAAPDASVDPSILPQTRDRPLASGAAFSSRAAALWDAIVADDPDRAMSFFFPLGAYRQVKDVANPAADWSHRLVAAYTHDIHALHAQIAAVSRADGAAIQFLGLDVPEERARWVEPGEEYNKIGYFRVFGSRLRYEVGGLTQTFDVKSLISWRGEWYVVHLSAIH